MYKVREKKIRDRNTMKANYIISIFLILLFVADSKLQMFIGEDKNRRILHQPLFTYTSSPPPQLQSLPPPSSDQNRPFLPNGQTVDQGQQTPPSMASSTAAASQPSNSIKKVAIAVSSAILSLAMLSALAFYLYKRRLKQRDDSQKLVGGNSQRTNEESRMRPSTFLYIGTVEPSSASIVNEANDAPASPYQKLNSANKSSRYRPSPDLQPLPLTKPPLPPPTINSPPPMSSCADESHETKFYTPHGSSMINESAASRKSYMNSNIRQINQTMSENPIPHLSGSSPDTKPVIIPSIKQSLPPNSSLGLLQHSKPLPFTPKRTKFPPPPPPIDVARLRSISNDYKQKSAIPIPTPPPPPPPPPPQVSIPRKFGDVHKYTPSPVSNKVIKPESGSRSPKSNPSPTNDPNKGVRSTEKTDIEDKNGSRPKLKPLHRDKVRATSDRVTVWDQLKSSSFQVNEDAMQSLFGCNSANLVPKEATRKSALPGLEKEIRVLDPKKSQNIAILLRALNVTREEVAEALLDGNPEGLGPELLETLVKMAPTKEEEIKLKSHKGESSRLGSAERFLKAILDIPFAFKRVEAMLYRANFHTEVAYLRKSFQTLEEASEELKNSRLFLKILDAVLRTGNRMNDGTTRGDARAFKLETLLKLVDIKGTDGKTTLLHFVVQEIIRSEGTDSNPASENQMNIKSKEEEFKKQGLQVVSRLSKEIGNVKTAAGMDLDVLRSYVSKLEMGLEKVRLVMQYERQSTQGKFFDSMKEFLKEATEEITRIKGEERKALSLVKEVTEYFHGNAAKEEAHPFRIFMIVRDFLLILDSVCKDVGRMHDGATVGAGRSFRMPATASLPVLSRYRMRPDKSPGEDSM